MRNASHWSGSPKIIGDFRPSKTAERMDSHLTAGP